MNMRSGVDSAQLRRSHNRGVFLVSSNTPLHIDKANCGPLRSQGLQIYK